MAMFHQGNRDLQRHFESTALADRLVERLRRSEFGDEGRQFVHSVEFFFLATAAPDGHPDCSFKGGAPGFVRQRTRRGRARRSADARVRGRTGVGPRYANRHLSQLPALYPRPGDRQTVALDTSCLRHGSMQPSHVNRA